MSHWCLKETINEYGRIAVSAARVSLMSQRLTRLCLIVVALVRLGREPLGPFLVISTMLSSGEGLALHCKKVGGRGFESIPVRQHAYGSEL